MMERHKEMKPIIQEEPSCLLSKKAKLDSLKKHQAKHIRDERISIHNEALSLEAQREEERSFAHRQLTVLEEEIRALHVQKQLTVLKQKFLMEKNWKRQRSYVDEQSKDQSVGRKTQAKSEDRGKQDSDLMDYPSVPRLGFLRKQGFLRKENPPSNSMSPVSYGDFSSPKLHDPPPVPYSTPALNQHRSIRRRKYPIFILSPAHAISVSPQRLYVYKERPGFKTVKAAQERVSRLDLSPRSQKQRELSERKSPEFGVGKQEQERVSPLDVSLGFSPQRQYTQRSSPRFHTLKTVPERISPLTISPSRKVSRPQENQQFRSLKTVPELLSLIPTIDPDQGPDPLSPTSRETRRRNYWRDRIRPDFTPLINYNTKLESDLRKESLKTKKTSFRLMKLGDLM